MASSRSNSDVRPPASQHPLHVSDADEEDESVKQLNECATIYLSLQECLVNSNRNWKACQARDLKEVCATAIAKRRVPEPAVPYMRKDFSPILRSVHKRKG